MKKIFSLIGVMLVIFSVYFMLLVVDKSNYISDERISDFSLEKQVGFDTLEKFAKESDVSVQIRTFNNYSFGKVQCKIEVINPKHNTQYGVMKSLFPNRHIEIVPNEKRKDRKARYFMVQDNELGKVSALKNILDKNGYNAEVVYKEPVKFSFEMLFSPLNIGFFVSIFCLSLFSTSIYYISRLKEIGILKLNGWSERRISVRLYKDIVKNTGYGFVPCAILFVLYIMFMDISQLPEYLIMLLFLILALDFVYICVAMVAVIFIKNTDYIDSIKNKKNNKIIFLMVMLFKVILVVVVLIISTQLIDNTLRLTEGVKRAEEIEAHNWYICTQHVALSSDEEKELDLYMQKFKSNEIFNYCPSDSTQDRNEPAVVYKDLDSIESNMIIASSNLISYLGIKNKNGNKLQIKDNREYLLIPENLWEKRSKIIKYEGLENIETICIPNGQWIMDLETPGKYSYNSVIQVSKLEKRATVSYGDVFMTENVAKQMEEKLLTMGYEKADIEMEELGVELRTHISTYQTELFESVIYFFIVFLTYVLVDISLYCIYYEFKKKKMAVYSLLGRKTVNDIFNFIFYNATIIVAASIIINRIFMFLIIPETIIFYIILSRKSFESIGTVIKGR